MKRLFLLSALLFLLCSFSVDSPFKVIGKKVLFQVENKDKSPVEIFITDGKGRTVFSEVVKDETIGKVFNFENTAPDYYTIKIKDGDILYTKSIEI